MGRWNLPRQDYWSTPFAEVLLSRLDLRSGLAVFDVACGHGIPAFYLAEQIGPSGQVLAIDCNEHQLARARSIQGAQLPWLRFESMDVRALPADLPPFDRITGNLSVMFFRPDRFATVQGLVRHLTPGGQIVLTFPSRGTFASLWTRIDREMSVRGLTRERERLAAYVAERPSAQDAASWLERLGLERVHADEWPLEVSTGPGEEFLYHPLLRAGFLDDVFECFDDQRIADDVMTAVARDTQSVVPLIAQRCVVSGWKR